MPELQQKFETPNNFINRKKAIDFNFQEKEVNHQENNPTKDEQTSL